MLSGSFGIESIEPPGVPPGARAAHQPARQFGRRAGQSSLGAYSVTAQRPGTAPAAPRWLVHMIAGTVLSDRPCASIKPSLQG